MASIRADIPEPSLVQALLQETVERILLPRFQNLAPTEVYKKGKDSLVTEADLAAERFLTQGLSALVQGSKVLGEEAIANDETRLRAFAQEHSSQAYWLIDPLDGTRNFIKGSNTFCSMVALVLGEKVRASWLYAHQEQSIFHAIEAEGAFVDNRPMPSLAAEQEQSNDDGVNRKSRGRISWTRKPLDYNHERIERLPSVRCAGQDFVDLACGRTDFSYYNNLWPWDHAPGGFLLKTLGGRLSDFATGRDYFPCERVGPILATRRHSHWQALQKALQEDNLQENKKNK